VTSFTVTGSATNGFDNVVLKVWVITGGTEAGGSSACGGGATGPVFTLTPAASGSVIVEQVGNYSNTTALTWEADNTQDDAQVTTYCRIADAHYTGTVTASSPVTLGSSNTSIWGAWTACEVIPSGTAAIDSATPAAVQGDLASATTAAFSPPAGAVLVASVQAMGNATQALSVSDTSGLGLTWTQRGTTYSQSYEGSAALFTATVPGGTPSVSGSDSASGLGQVGVIGVGPPVTARRWVS